MKCIRVISNVETIKIMSDPLRLRILNILSNRGRASAPEVAADLGLSTANVSYHLKLLEQHGLIELAETRTKGNLLENVYAPTADDFVIQRKLLGGGDDEARHGIAQMVQGVASMITEDLLALSTSDMKALSSALLYNTYYLTEDEGKALTSSIVKCLDQYSQRQPGAGLTPYNIGFLLLNKTEERTDTDEEK